MSASVGDASGREAGEALRRLVREIVMDLGGKFFRGAVPALDREASEARSDYLRRMAEEASVFLRGRRSVMENDLMLNVIRSVQVRDVQELEADELSEILRMSQQDSHEDSEALDGIASQIEMECFAVLSDIQGRFDALKGQAGERMPNVTPLAFIDAFRKSMGENELERGSRMLLYNAFSRLFLSGLRSYYGSLLEALNRYGVTSTHDGAVPVISLGGEASSVDLDPWMETGRGDAMLAVELASSVPGCSRTMQVEIARRAAMVGSMFSGLTTGFSVPMLQASQIGGLRPLVVRAATPTREFFVNPEHPLRTTLSKIALQAGLVTLDPKNSRPLFDEIYNQLRRSCSDPATAHFTEIGPDLTADQIATFKADLDQKVLSRTVEFHRKARFWSGRMVYNLASGARLSDRVAQVLWKTWHLPVATILKEFGRESENWRSMVQLTDQMMFILAKTPESFASIACDLSATLRDAKLTEEDIQSWVANLAHALSSSRPTDVTTIMSLMEVSGGLQATQRSASPKATIEDLLGPYLRADTWFQLYDPHVMRRWRKVNSYYPEMGRLSFVDIDGQNATTVIYSELLTQIAAGQSVPFTMPPEELTQLCRLISAH